MTAARRSGSPSPGSGNPVPTLLFVPDISGFTRFVNETEISHSRHIIAELLEILIDADELGLTVSEIEGDAILFYREGEPPSGVALLAQVEAMYAAFHSHLRRYDVQRICQCGACCSAVDLELKFVVHHGVVAEERVKDHSKLFGRDVILVHRLLKNEVDLTEYALFTDALVAGAGGMGLDDASWAPIQAGIESYDLGDVAYHFLALAPLRDRVPEPAIEAFGLPGAALLFQAHVDIAAPIGTVFNAVSDLSFRHEWQVGLVGSDQLNHEIVQTGSTHRCVIKDDPSDPFWVAHDFHTAPGFVTFTETEREQGFATVYALRSDGPRSTRLESHFFADLNPVKRAIFRLFLRRRTLAGVMGGLEKLRRYCEELVERGGDHPVQVVLEGSEGSRAPAGEV